MPKKLLVFIGGVENNDHQGILEMSKDRSDSSWSSTKNASPGDKVLLYVAKPASALIAKAEILTSAKPGKHWQYEAKIGHVRLLKNQLTIKILKKQFPNWKWLRFPRGKCTVPLKYAKRLWKLVHQKPKTTLQPNSNNGAGFGNYESNKLVEAFAIRKVTYFYKARGYSVKSVERDKVGFDLKVYKGKLELHVEVKGIQGVKPEFILTANEKHGAAKDPQYRLAIVTNAKSRNYKLKILSGKRLLNAFKLTPISFKASPL